MYLDIKKIEHPVTREDYRYGDGRRVFDDSPRKIKSKTRPQVRTKEELEALHDCGVYGIQIVRRFSVRFELREAHREGKRVVIDRLWTGTVKLEDDAAIEYFWRELELRIANEKPETIERIRQQAEALIGRTSWSKSERKQIQKEAASN